MANERLYLLRRKETPREDTDTPTMILVRAINPEQARSIANAGWKLNRMDSIWLSNEHSSIEEIFTTGALGVLLMNTRSWVGEGAPHVEE